MVGYRAATAQVKHAIEVFEKAHPNCVALFIFDQSSTHASLGPDALKASEMNKSDGGSSMYNMTQSSLNQTQLLSTKEHSKR